MLHKDFNLTLLYKNSRRIVLTPFAQIKAALSWKYLVPTCLIFNLMGCATSSLVNDSAPKNPVDLTHVKEPVPKVEPKSKYGNPKKYTVLGNTYKTMDDNKNYSQTGIASWYGTKFHGRRTSSGEVYDMYEMTGAHKTLPLPTYAKVTNLDNNKSIIIKINDRGPFHENRIVDLSYAAASKLGVLAKGTARVHVVAIDPREHDLAKTKPHSDNNQYALNNPAEKTIKQPTPSRKVNKELVHIQLGAFKDRDYAEQLVKNVESVIQHPVTITTVNKQNLNKKLFKVQLGPIPAEKLELIKSKLAHLNIYNPITIARQ